MILTCRLISVRHLVTGMAISFVLLLCAANAAAQASRVGASLEGTISDSSRAVIPQAAIALRNTLTNQSRTVTTDDQGFFRADQLAVGCGSSKRFAMPNKRRFAAIVFLIGSAS
jgi:hypothetical protein